ncbi:uncharacterized protein [Cherax quadricarinatus]|uniref:uncharacterized protein isoform X1 n=2 Tax=Cherax quadricarinatus TaxID=27406 RepID=UPI00387E90B8
MGFSNTLAVMCLVKMERCVVMLVIGLWCCSFAALHENHKEPEAGKSRQMLLTSEDNGFMIATLFIAYLWRNLVYLGVTKLTSSIDFGSEEAPEWIRKEYGVLRNFSTHYLNMINGREVILTNTSPFIPKSPRYEEVGDPSEGKLFTLIREAKEINELVNTTHINIKKIVDSYTRFTDVLLNRTRLRKLVSVVSTTDYNMVGLFDWAMDKVFYEISGLLKVVKKRYSSGKPIGSKSDLVNAMDKVFGVCSKIYNNKLALGDYFQAGITWPNPNIFTGSASLLKGALDYYKIKINFKPYNDLPITVKFPEFNAITGVVYPPDEIEISVNASVESEVAQFSHWDLGKALGKYEMEKVLELLTFLTQAKSLEAYYQVQSRLKILVDIYHKISSKPVEVSNFTLDFTTLKLIAAHKGEGDFGLPEDLAFIIKNLPWKKSRGKRGASSYGTFPEYRTQGGFWDTLSSFFGYSSELSEDSATTSDGVHGEDGLNDTSTHSEECVPDEGALCNHREERDKPLVPRYQGSSPRIVNPKDDYIPSVYVDLSEESNSTQTQAEELDALEHVGVSILNASSWKEVEVALELPENFTHIHEDLLTKLEGKLKYSRAVKCVTGVMCRDCAEYVTFQTGEEVCCYSCFMAPHIIDTDTGRLCFCHFAAPNDVKSE